MERAASMALRAQATIEQEPWADALAALSSHHPEAPTVDESRQSLIDTHGVGRSASFALLVLYSPSSTSA